MRRINDVSSKEGKVGCLELGNLGEAPQEMMLNEGAGANQEIILRVSDTVGRASA